MYVKIHSNERCKLLAVCDESVLGKTFEEGDLFLKVDETFYQGELKSAEEVKVLLNEFDNFNLVGKEIVGLALELNLVSEEGIIYIQKVPHISRMCL